MSTPSVSSTDSEASFCRVTHATYGPLKFTYKSSASHVGVAHVNVASSVVVKVYKRRAGMAAIHEPHFLRRIKERYRSIPPFFVDILEDYSLSQDPCITLEHCRGGNLADWREHMLEGTNGMQFSEKKIWDVYSSLVAALLFLKYGNSGRPSVEHERNWKPLFHRDIKPTNVLVRTHGLNQPEDFVLCDFGMAVERDGVGWSKRNSRRCGTSAWMAPEHFYPTHDHKRLKRVPLPGEKLDVWGIGAVVHFLALGRAPVAHCLDTAYPKERGNNFEITLARAPTFIDMFSTGTRAEAGTRPPNVIYSKQLNCRMMEALAFNPKKRATADRLAVPWNTDAGGQRHKRWPSESAGFFRTPTVRVPGWGRMFGIRPSPPHCRYAGARYLWKEHMLSRPTRAMDCAGVPFDLDQAEWRDYDLQTTMRRRSFDDWQVARPDPCGLLKRKSYPAVRARLADVHAVATRRRAQRQQILQEGRDRFHHAMVLLEFPFFMSPNLEVLLEDYLGPFHEYPTTAAFFENERPMHDRIEQEARQFEMEVVRDHRIAMRILRMCRRISRRTGVPLEDVVARFDDTARLPGWSTDAMIHHILESDSSEAETSDEAMSSNDESEKQQPTAALSHTTPPEAQSGAADPVPPQPATEQTQASSDVVRQGNTSEEGSLSAAAAPGQPTGVGRSQTSEEQHAVRATDPAEEQARPTETGTAAHARYDADQWDASSSDEEQLYSLSDDEGGSRSKLKRSKTTKGSGSSRAPSPDHCQGVQEGESAQRTSPGGSGSEGRVSPGGGSRVQVESAESPLLAQAGEFRDRSGSAQAPAQRHRTPEHTEWERRLRDPERDSRPGSPEKQEDDEDPQFRKDSGPGTFPGFTSR